MVKFDATGTRLWGTYYGGTGDDRAYFCSTDATSNVYLVGNTNSNTGTVIATPSSHQALFGGGSNSDAFLVKFNSSGIRQWGTYYGGSGIEYGYSCITDALGNVYMADATSTNASTIIATSGSHQSTFGGAADAYLVKFNANGVRQWGTYYGGIGGDGVYACTIDNIGNIYITGSTSTNTGTIIATPGSHQSVYTATSSLTNAFLAKFDVCDVAPAQPLSFNGLSTLCSGVAATFTTPVAYSANVYTLSIPSGSVFSSNNTFSIIPLSSGIYTLLAGNACGVSPQQTLNVIVNVTPTVSVNSGSICAGQSFTLTGSGAATYTYSGSQIVSPIVTSSYSVTGTSTAGCVSSNTAISTVIVNPLPFVSVNSGAICVGQSFTIVPSATGGGAATYTYSGGGAVVSPAVTTSYSITGTSAAGCVSSNTAISTVTVSNIYPTITVNSGAICSGKSFTITPSGAATYTIQGGNFVVSPATTSNYSVAGTSTAGCLSSNTVIATVSINPLPTITILSSNPLICEGETATLTASTTGGGASTYTFNPGGAATSITVSPTSNTNYQVTGTDNNGCKNTATITQSVDACTGIAPEILNQTSQILNIFPNPSSGLLNLELNTNNEIVIINALGQLVYSTTLSAGQHQLNLEHLAKGMYLIRASVDKSLKSIKLIKE